jgi:hypothetical protein
MLRQVASVAVSWSTVVLFGEVPRTREPHLVVMGVGCLVWAVAVVGVVFPPFAAFLFGLIPLPEPYGDMLAWYVMVVLAVAVPPDLVIRGAERDVNRVRALLSEQLAFSTAYLTWDEQANAIEDRLRAIWRDARGVTTRRSIPRSWSDWRRSSGCCAPSTSPSRSGRCSVARSCSSSETCCWWRPA